MAEQMNRARLVPKNRRPYDDIDALAKRHGWRLDEEEEGGAAQWQVPDGDTVVRWVEDGDTGVHFFVVEGSGRENVAKQIQDEIAMLRVEDFEAYLNNFYGADGLMRGLYTVAAAAPRTSDQRVISVFEKYFQHEDPLVRRVALIATSIVGWSDFVEPVSRLRGDDDSDVREAAEATLRALGVDSP